MDNWHTYWGSPVITFGFVILIILLNGIFSVMRTRQRQETIRELIKSGQQLDPSVMRELTTDKESQEDSRQSKVVAGVILIAVAIGLAFLGYQIEQVTGDDEVFPILSAVAAIPGLIGVALLILSVIMGGSKKSSE